MEEEPELQTNWALITVTVVAVVVLLAGVVMFWTALDLYGDSEDMRAKWIRGQCQIKEAWVNSRTTKLGETFYRAMFLVETYAEDGTQAIRGEGFAVTGFRIQEWRVNHPILELAQEDLARYPVDSNHLCLIPSSDRFCAPVSESESEASNNSTRSLQRRADGSSSESLDYSEENEEEMCFAVLDWSASELDEWVDRYRGLFWTGIAVFIAAAIVLVICAIAFIVIASRANAEAEEARLQEAQ
mmetsp:Transcript_103331/g.143987  ORF Transcript_103331/g.143987 Transcript_103331/m.143987 type:complete len:243 (+) Transcript_103331:64-792(+)